MTQKRVLFFILVLGLFLVSCGTKESSETVAPSMNQPVIDSEDIDENVVVPDKSIPCGDDAIDVSKQPQVSVAIQGNKFSSSSLKIKSGTKVTWTNMNPAAHNVKSSDGTLDSPDLFKGDSWSFTFTSKGTYNYICGIHPSMKGSITVE